MRPSARPIGGIRTPSTSVVTILPKAAPMMTPTARSITFPRAMKSRNSFHISPPVARRLNDHAQSKPRQGKSCDRAGGGEPESGTDGREERAKPPRVASPGFGRWKLPVLLQAACEDEP